MLWCVMRFTVLMCWWSMLCPIFSSFISMLQRNAWQLALENLVYLSLHILDDA